MRKTQQDKAHRRCSGVHAFIFMDYQMPVLDGIESSREILKIKKDVCIIGCTAFTTKEHVMNCYEVGMKDVIFKPIKKEIIGKILSQWLN